MIEKLERLMTWLLTVAIAASAGWLIYAVVSLLAG